MAQPESVEDVKRLIEEHDIEFIFASFTEIRGKASAKLVPASQVDELFSEGVGFAGFAAGEIGQGPQSPDIEVIPDPRTFRIVPWKKGLAHVIGNATVEGKPWPYCPRTILQNQMKKAEEQGYVFKLGFEAEFMLVDFDDEGKLKVADKYDNWGRPCYDVKALTRQYDLMTRLSNYVTELGWDNYAVDHEDGNGQFEINVTFSDALETADRSVFFRYMVDSLAEEYGMIATFMPKPFTDNTGNGMHYTMSLWDKDTDENLFLDENDPRGMDMSELGYQFVAGVLDHARGYMAMVAPTVNSYKRLKAGTETVRTWVPVAMTYGGNNRTQMMRIARSGAVEDRTPDFSGSTYLGFTAALASGLDGIKRKLDPGQPNDLDLYLTPPREIERRGIRMLPHSLMESVHYLVKDEVLREAFGQVPVEDEYGRLTDETEAFVDHYARIKRAEYHKVTDEVTAHEIDLYLRFP